MSTADIDRTLDEFRGALLSRERMAAAEMARAYGAAFRRIDAELAQLLDALAIAQARGVAGPSWLYRRGRLEALISQIAAELDSFGAFAAGRIAAEQAIIVERASAHSLALIEAGMGSAPDGVTVGWNVLPREQLTDLVGVLQDGSPLRSLFDRFGAQASIAAQEALITGVTLGRNPRVIGRELRRILGTTLSRALTVARTEMLRPYRTAALRSYQANSQVVKAWRWVARVRGGGRGRTCAVCWAMHGTIHPLSEPFGSHPNCRCAPAPVTVTWAELGLTGIPDEPLPPTGVEVFRGLPVAEQRAILGPWKLRAYQEGRLRLPDLVGVRDDPAWGRGRYERSLRELGLSGTHP